MTIMGETGRRALLIDLFDTLVTADFEVIQRELAGRVGCSVAELDRCIGEFGVELMTSPDAIRAAFAELLRRTGHPAGEADVDDLIACDRQLLVAHSRVFDDARALIERARSAEWRIALVSNCAPNAAAIVEAFDIDEWVDEVVLSCDVGAVKPQPAIFYRACERLGVARDEAVFVDDQLKYCQGAADLGIEAYWVDRIAASGPVLLDGVIRVASCDAVLGAASH